MPRSIDHQSPEPKPWLIVDVDRGVVHSAVFPRELSKTLESVDCTFVYDFTSSAFLLFFSTLWKRKKKQNNTVRRDTAMIPACILTFNSSKRKRQGRRLTPCHRGSDVAVPSHRDVELVGFVCTWAKRSVLFPNRNTALFDPRCSGGVWLRHFCRTAPVAVPCDDGMLHTIDCSLECCRWRTFVHDLEINCIVRPRHFNTESNM